MSLTLRNPHSVLALLESRPQDLLEVRLSTPRPHGVWQEVVDEAYRRKIPVGQTPERPDSRRRQKQGPSDDAGRTSPTEAVIREKPEEPWEQVISAEKVQASPHGVWLALDQIQDPHNVGAIFRTAAFFGIQGILLTRDRSAPLTGTVYDVASGGVEVVPHSQRANLAQGLQVAKEAGVWVLGSSEHAEQDISQVTLDRPWLLVLGNEERGLRQLTLKSCDEICRLTPRGKVTSLNVSPAGGILMAALCQSKGLPKG